MTEREHFAAALWWERREQAQDRRERAKGGRRVTDSVAVATDDETEACWDASERGRTDASD